MMTSYMLNELSIDSVSTIPEIREILKQFVLATVKANRAGFRDLRIYLDSGSILYSLPFMDDYKMSDWLNDPSVNFDMKAKFRDILSSSPLVRPEELIEIDIYNRSEFQHTHEGITKVAHGLGAAYIHQTLCLSFLSREYWTKSHIDISHYQINVSGSNSTVDVRKVYHFFDEVSFVSHTDWIQNIQLKALQRSEDLWINRTTIYPNLVFCQEVKSQIMKVGASKVLNQIFDRLHALNSYVADWTVGDFDYLDLNSKTNLRVSPESDTTINKFGTLRKFKISDGRKVVFTLHIKTGNLRFHFYPDNASQTVYIGYIGSHLRISSEG